MRHIALAYGVLCYVLFLGAFLYAVGFVGDVFVPKSVDAPVVDVGWPRALVQDAVLLLLFAVPHSIMARGGFKLRTVIWGLFWFGWLLALVSTFLINHFELFGLRQVYLLWMNQPDEPMSFRTPFLYRWVRHPLILGFLIAFWAAPTMTGGRLLFAVATTGYCLVALQLEERDLLRYFGDQYSRYQKQVRMLVPIPRRKRDGQ